MLTSGLVLDIYDDYNGETLRELYPSFESIPEGVKQAHPAIGAARDRLPDDVFALVLVNNGEKLRKYACIDEGNTVLSVQYFLKHAHKLPLEAQKVAAENLKAACSWYALAVPEELEKAALGLGTAMSALTAVPVIKGTHQAIKENMGAVRAGEAAGAGIVTPQMRNEMLGRKTAELSGTAVMPSQGPGDPKASPSKAVVAKTAMGHLVPGHKGEHGNFGPEETEKYDGYTKGKTPKRLPQARHLSPVVDVSKKEASAAAAPRPITHYAMPSQNKYPLDSYDQVKTASQYFDQFVKHMSPPMRHEFASNLVKRANDLTISVSDVARKYGADDFAPEIEIKAAFDARRLVLEGQPGVLSVLDNVERVARFRMWKEADEKIASTDSPEFVAELLAQFDRAAGLDRHYDRSVPDPFYSIFGFEKSASDEAWSDVIGNDMVTSATLKRFANVGGTSISNIFGADFHKEFRKDPVGIYKSLPLDQKKMLIRMANAAAPDNERTV